jgi:retinoic acid-induced protein 1
MKRIRRKPVQEEINPCFHPHVRINNSRDFSSWCAIINSLEEATPIIRFKKKRLAKMKNPITAAKVVPHSMAMLQGPLVNRTLIDRCLTCCLCGNSSNYRDLGDLCGPYYTEDSMPRKILSSRRIGGFRGVPEKTEDSSNNNNSNNNNNNNNNSSSIAEEPSSSSTSDPDCGTEKEVSAEGSTGGGISSNRSSSAGQHHWRHRRPEGTLERSGPEVGPRRLTLRERFRRIKQLKDMERGQATGATSHQVAGTSGLSGVGSFQRLREEAEANEHWAHENCTIWTRGVIMVAGRLYGLTEAARASTQTVR